MQAYRYFPLERFRAYWYIKYKREIEITDIYI